MTSQTPNAVPLRDLAEKGFLPAHQSMDQDTLTWIVENRPTVGVAPTTLPHRSLLLVPKVSWFADARLADCIHGIGHNARVCLLSSLLAREYGLSRDDITALCSAAAVHDCQRRDDRADPGHGKRAARWFERNSATVTAVFGQHLSAHAVACAATAIGLHDIPYAAFTPAEHRAYQQAGLLVDLLKAADCLDRYRLPHMRWWPDPSHLRIAIPDWLHRVAFDLVVRSEQARLDGTPHHKALTHARQALSCGQ